LSQINSFSVCITNEQIDDLRNRLHRTRWPEKETVEDWSQGIPLAYTQELAAYWATDYDMQRVANRLNRYEQFTTEVDDVDIHFLHVRSPEPDATPCIMTHGWPGSVVEFLKVIDPLTNPAAHGGDPADALHLVIPSLPGYGWSGKPAVTGWGIEKIADAWATLMQRLGYHRYLAQGGDWGATVTWSLGQQDGPHLIGLHTNLMIADPQKVLALPDITEQEKADVQKLVDYQTQEAGYAIEQSTKPQTMGYGLTDSPVGQLSWIIEKFRTWSDCDGDLESLYTRDELLDNVMTYWLNGTAASSARLYWQSTATSLGSFLEVPAPSAYTNHRKELLGASERVARMRFTDMRYYGSVERGGHFAAFEVPEIFVEEVQAGFRAIKATG
jgi:pimeloyl-ACP methyl ester carboxylesterase